MDIFNIIAGAASIVSLLIGIVSLCKIKEVEKTVSTKFNVSGTDNIANTTTGECNQTIQTRDITNSSINQNK